MFQPFRDFEGMPEPYRSRAFDRAKKKFDIMNELGAKTILVCSNTSNLAVGGIDRAADDFNELGEIAKNRNIFIGYEALAWGKYISDHRDAWEIVRRANHNNVGIILDSFHTLSRDINLDSIASIPKEKIFIVQIADAPNTIWIYYFGVDISETCLGKGILIFWVLCKIFIIQDMIIGFH